MNAIPEFHTKAAKEAHDHIAASRQHIADMNVFVDEIDRVLATTSQGRERLNQPEPPDPPTP